MQPAAFNGPISGRRPWPCRQPCPTEAPGRGIGIVTPSLNQGRFIEETILSVLHQDYPAVEHIVMDGGSTDETAAILARYQDRLAFAASEKDKGQSEAINKGPAPLTGEITVRTWLNADDMLAPGALAAVALAFATSGADLVAGICVIHDEGRILHRHLTAAADGPLSLAELLDLEGGWLEGEFFYSARGLLLARSRERAGGKVEEGSLLQHGLRALAALRRGRRVRCMGIGRPLGACFPRPPGAEAPYAPPASRPASRRFEPATFSARSGKPPAAGAGASGQSPAPASP